MFASGIWQGVENAQANQEKKRMDDSVLAQQAADRQYKQFLIDRQKATDTREQQANTAAGASIRQMGTPPPPQFNGAYTGDLGGVLPPQASVAAQPPQMFSQSPMPGQASVPSQPRQMGASPQTPQQGRPPQPQQQGQAQPQPMPYRTVGNTQPPQAQVSSQPQPQGYTPQYQPQRQPTGVIEQFVASVKGLSDDQVGMAFTKVHPFLQMQMQNEAKESEQKLRIYTKLQQEAAKERELTERERHDRAMEGRKPASSSGEGGIGASNKDAVTTLAEQVLMGSRPYVPAKLQIPVNQAIADIAKSSKNPDGSQMTVRDLLSASADVKSQLLAKRSFEVRAQNTERAANQILKEIPVVEKAMKSLDPSDFPALARLSMSAIRQGVGTKEAQAAMVTLDRSAEIMFREFEAIANGNPAKLNIQDVHNAEKDYQNASTPTQMKAAIKVIQDIAERAKDANVNTRSEIMKGVNNTLGGEKPQEGGKIKFLGFE